MYFPNLTFLGGEASRVGQAFRFLRGGRVRGQSEVFSNGAGCLLRPVSRPRPGPRGQGGIRVELTIRPVSVNAGDQGGSIARRAKRRLDKNVQFDRDVHVRAAPDEPAGMVDVANLFLGAHVAQSCAKHCRF
jgi:hypothetical protein